MLEEKHIKALNTWVNNDTKRAGKVAKFIMLNTFTGAGQKAISFSELVNLLKNNPPMFKANLLEIEYNLKKEIKDENDFDVHAAKTFVGVISSQTELVNAIRKIKKGLFGKNAMYNIKDNYKRSYLS